MEMREDRRTASQIGRFVEDSEDEKRVNCGVRASRGGV
jgi:hypothetical protein